jgi:serine/threonine protein phosphatase PrpC
MGNLLGSPVTDKDTHTGTIAVDETTGHALKFGLSSMQGWRVHMEDAHIAEGNLYAKLSPTTTGNAEEILPVKGHSLFAVYDGHGGTFAAMYAGRNFLRILSKQPKWIEYAKLLAEKERKAEDGSAVSSTSNKEGMDPVHRELIEAAMRQAFVETDYEIALAIRGSPHPDANQLYHKKPSAPPPAPAASSGDGNDNSNNAGDGDATMSTTSQEEGDASASSSSASAMEAASRAAADHVSALDDEGDSGTTACVVLITPTAILCANAGDSRAVYSVKDTRSSSQPGGGGHGHVAVALSYDHKPDDQLEETRIRNAGGYVAGGRVEGDLAVSRGLGDFRFKEMPTVMRNMDVTGPGGTNSSTSNSDDPAADSSTGDNTTMDGDDTAADTTPYRSSFQVRPPGQQKVSPIPDFVVHPRNNETDEFVIVACDGIWDVRSNQDCVMEVAAMFQEGESDLGLVSEEVRCFVVD